MSRKLLMAVAFAATAIAAGRAAMPDRPQAAIQAAVNGQASSSELGCRTGLDALTPQARQARIEAQVNGTLSCR